MMKTYILWSFILLSPEYLRGMYCFLMQQLREQERRGDFIDLKLRALNDRLMLAERGFLDVEGLQGRQWFKHLVSVLLVSSSRALTWI
jgi:hypothetical protein